MYAKDSIELLSGSGIQFKKHEDEGIEVDQFAELLMTSGSGPQRERQVDHVSQVKHNCAAFNHDWSAHILWGYQTC